MPFPLENKIDVRTKGSYSPPGLTLEAFKQSKLNQILNRYKCAHSNKYSILCLQPAYSLSLREASRCKLLMQRIRG